MGVLLLVIIELFSLDAFVLSQYTRLRDRQNLDSNTVRRPMLRSRTVKMGLHIDGASCRRMFRFRIRIQLSCSTNILGGETI